ncbi:hypothetical protein DFS34DRAFT_694450 [Phlyctochytrium arcticum]|nr:hypothetical protein DFS34DRAFT_694450 [Phlyctochytrium arcticum]
MFFLMGCAAGCLVLFSTAVLTANGLARMSAAVPVPPSSADSKLVKARREIRKLKEQRRKVSVVEAFTDRRLFDFEASNQDKESTQLLPQIEALETREKVHAFQKLFFQRGYQSTDPSLLHRIDSSYWDARYLPGEWNQALQHDAGHQGSIGGLSTGVECAHTNFRGRHCTKAGRYHSPTRLAILPEEQVRLSSVLTTDQDPSLLFTSRELDYGTMRLQGGSDYERGRHGVDRIKRKQFNSNISRLEREVDDWQQRARQYETDCAVYTTRLMMVEECWLGEEPAMPSFNPLGYTVGYWPSGEVILRSVLAEEGDPNLVFTSRNLEYKNMRLEGGCDYEKGRNLAAARFYVEEHGPLAALLAGITLMYFQRNLEK